jgi:hypothetical protein
MGWYVQPMPPTAPARSFLLDLHIPLGLTGFAPSFTALMTRTHGFQMGLSRLLIHVGSRDAASVANYVRQFAPAVPIYNAWPSDYNRADISLGDPRTDTNRGR